MNDKSFISVLAVFRYRIPLILIPVAMPVPSFQWLKTGTAFCTSYKLFKKFLNEVNSVCQEQGNLSPLPVSGMAYGHSQLNLRLVGASDFRLKKPAIIKVIPHDWL